MGASLLLTGEQKWLEMIKLRHMIFKDGLIFLLSGHIGVGKISHSWLTIMFLNKACIALLHLNFGYQIERNSLMRLQNLPTAIRKPSFLNALELPSPIHVFSVKICQIPVNTEYLIGVLIFFQSNPHCFFFYQFPYHIGITFS